MTAPSRHSPIGDLVRVFGRLGLTAFGGPAAHISMMHDEVVTRRGWMDDQRFLDLIGVTNLIPGPNSTEMAMHVGHQRAGWRGLVVAGASFIVPAALIVLVFAWAYVNYGTAPSGQALLQGIKPVVVVIVVQALVRLSRSTVKGRLTALVGVVASVSYLAGINELAILVLGALFCVAVRSKPSTRLVSLLPIWSMGESTKLVDGGDPVLLGRLFLVFLKAGALLYGSGYVLLAFLRNDLVEGLQVLTEEQLFDAIAIGQLTPGPLFTTATFIGYLLAGFPGAVVATVGIFLPSFLFVGAVTPLVRRIRDRRWTSDLLDGINAAALGLMAAVALQLGVDSFDSPFSVAIGAGAALALWRTRLNSTWLIVAGASAALGLGVVSAGW